MYRVILTSLLWSIITVWLRTVFLKLIFWSNSLNWPAPSVSSLISPKPFWFSYAYVSRSYVTLKPTNTIWYYSPNLPMFLQPNLISWSNFHIPPAISCICESISYSYAPVVQETSFLAANWDQPIAYWLISNQNYLQQEAHINIITQI